MTFFHGLCEWGPPNPSGGCRWVEPLITLQAFDEVKSRTSIAPFAAILDGRQQLPADYYKEFLRLPYFTILLITLGTYAAHPVMQQASAWLGW